MKAVYVDKDIPRSLAVKALRRVWPGVVYSRVSPAGLVDLGSPGLPGPRWLRVRNDLCGICGSDLSLLEVKADPTIAPVALPGIQRLFLGHEVVSTVVEVGPAVTRFSVGDRVVMDTRFQGANCRSLELRDLCRHCEAGNYTLCENASVGGPRGVGGGWGDEYTAHETEVYPVRDGLNDEQAMMVEPISVGLRSALLRTPKAGQHALVIGCGIVGLNVVQSIRAVAPKSIITAVARHDHQVEAARRLGADNVLQRKDLYEAAVKITGAKLYEGLLGNRMLLGGFDLVYDCVGNATTIQDSLRLAAAGGAVVLVGIEFAPMKVDLSPVWYQEVDLCGLYAHGVERWEGRERHTYDIVMEMLAEGRLTTEGLVTHSFSLDRWRSAVDTAKDKRSGAIKVAFSY